MRSEERSRVQTENLAELPGKPNWSWAHTRDQQIQRDSRAWQSVLQTILLPAHLGKQGGKQEYSLVARER